MVSSQRIQTIFYLFSSSRPHVIAHLLTQKHTESYLIMLKECNAYYLEGLHCQQDVDTHTLLCILGIKITYLLCYQAPVIMQMTRFGNDEKMPS